jgi:hypothetical protein
VRVKTAIAVANAGIRDDMAGLEATPYWNIFMIAEFKGLIETIKEINTKNGKFSEFRGLRETVAQVEYIAQIRQQDVDKTISGLEKEIDVMQDNLDAYNATTDIVAIDGISIQ